MASFMVPYTAQVMTICSKDIDRVRLSTARAANLIIGDIVGVLVITICGFVFTSQAMMYQVGAGINSLLVAIFMLISVFCVPEPSSVDVGCPTARRWR